MKKVILLLVSLATPLPLAAQQDPVLAAAVRLATEGQGDSARALVHSLLQQRDPVDSLYADILFAAGVVAADIDSARTYFRRVSIEYARSARADEALLRLAQLSFAAGDYPAAARSAEHVLLDYPLSTLHADAAYWAGRVAFELGDAERGCRHLLAAEQDAGDKVELLNQVRYYLQRCGPVITDRPSPDTVEAEDTAVAPAGPTFFGVQVAAVAGAAAANELMQSLHSQGYDSRVFRDTDGLFKIRVGRFSDRRDAVRLVAELKRKLGGQPFVVEQR